MNSQVGGGAKGPLEAAQEIVAALSDMSADHQALALKFACETLGLLSPMSAPMPARSLNAEASIAAPGAIRHPEHSADIKAFSAMKAPKSDQQFTAVVAYFYQFEARSEERRDYVDPPLMKEAARLAAWPQAGNWRVTLNNAKSAGYLDSAGEGKFKLSSVGENLVAITLPDQSGAGGARSQRRGSGGARRKIVKKVSRNKR